jgi:hypothetical protein
MRQLLVSNGTAVSYTNNVLAAGAVDVVKLTTDGFSSLSPGETISDSDQIRIVQGSADGNIFSPWIPGKDIIKWTGASYVAQTAQVTTLTVAVVATAAGDMSIKLIDSNGGQAPFNRRNAAIAVTTGLAAQTIAERLFQQLTGQSTLPASGMAIPGFPTATAGITGAVITVTGTVFSLTANTELGSFRVASENMDASNGTTLTVATTPLPSLGYGSPQVLAQYENSLKADRSYWNRIELPNTPDSYIVASDTYDTYTIAFQNSTPGSIHGVDNKRAISIAYKVSGTGQAAFEGKINPWLNSCPGNFAAVQL